MTRTINYIKPVCLFVLFVFTYYNGISQAKKAGNKPNIIFILADDLTKWDVGCYGSVDSKTPTIDSLASLGMKFNKCYQAAPMCSPTRHNLLTGMYPVRTGAYPNHTYAKEGTKSVVHYLKPLGYRVALSGKRHILTKKVFPFEYIDGTDSTTTDPDLTRVESFLKNVSEGNEKFCLFLNFKSPHSPWTEGNPDLFDKNSLTLPPYLADLPKTRESFRDYLAEINFLDGQIKQTLDLLKKYNFSENTIVMFATEQGNSFPFAKWTLYNAGVGSGLIVSWPGKIKPGTESDALVEYSDILPTMIDAAGGKPINTLDGSSLLPVLLDDKKTHKQYTYSLQTTRTIFSGSEYFPVRSVSDGTYRLIVNLTPTATFKNIVTEKSPFFEEWRKSTNPEYTALANRYQHRPGIELYNDEEDPYDMHDLARDPQYAGKIKNLRQKLQEWMSYCGDEGIRTELEANLHSHHRLNSTEKVSIHLDFLPAENQGNFNVQKDGFYFFYSKDENEINIDGQPLYFGNKNGIQYSNYAVIALKKGDHSIPKEQGKSLDWSGPDMKKTKFEYSK